MRHRSARFHLQQIVAIAAAGLLWLSLLAAPVAAGDSPLGDAAAPWPTSWVTYGYSNGNPIIDVSDNNPGYSDLWAGSADNLPTVYFTTDGTNAFFRVRVRNDPDSKNGGFNSTSWLVSVAVGGTQAAVVGLNGKPSATDYVYITDADGTVTSEIYTTPFTNDGSGTSAGARIVTAPDEGFFIDFQVPISQITAVAPSVTGSTPVQLFFGTSQAANLSVINKDFMVGGAVSYVGLATLRLDGEDPGPANSAPDAANDSTTTTEGSSVLTDVLANDTDPDGDPLTVTAFDASSANGGTVSCTTAGDCTYSPPAGFTGTDSYTYTASDGNGGNDTATVTVTVTAANTPPDAANDAALTDEDTAVVTAVLANDTDADGDALTVSGFDAASVNGGAVSCTAGGNCTYTPPSDFSGTDSYTYTVADGKGGTDTATVTVTVNPVNDAPDAMDDTRTVNEDGSVVVAVLANDSDPEGDALTVTAASNPPNGTTAVNGNGTVTYTPDPNFHGTDSFTYTVCDTGGLCDTATVTVTVDSVNDDPVAVDDTSATAEDAPVVTAVLANDTDADGDAMTVTAFDTTSANGGTVSCTTGGDCTYTPPAGFSGSDSYTYTADDGNGGTDTAAVTITVVAVNDTPIAVDDSPSTAEDTPVVVAVMANDSDPDGDTLSIDFFTQPGRGTVTDNLDGTLTYTPPADWSGTTTFLYRICDDGSPSLCDEATVTVTVTAENDAPIANDDNAATDALVAVVTNVLGNDTDVDGDTLTVSVFDAASANGGSVSCAAGGDCTYTPPAAFSGTDTFTYTASDGNGGTDTATVTVVVTAINVRPTPASDAITVTEDTPLGTPTATLLANDTDPDGPLPLTVTAVTNGSHGTVTLAGTTVTYTPAPDYFGPDSFTYTVCDGAGGCSTETVNVTVDPENDSPEAKDDTATTDEDVAVVVVVLANDLDVDGDTLSVTSIPTTPVSGTATINGDNTVTYTPAPDFFGVDEFQYEISDGNGGTTTAWVRFVVVNPVNDAPTAGDDAATVDEDGAVTVAVLTNDADVENDPMTVTATSAPAGGTVAINGDNTVTYTPDPDYFGPDSFTYTVCDSGGLCDTATVAVTVDPVNDAPIAAADLAMAAEDGSVVVPVLANDDDIENDPLTVTAVTVPANGTVTINGDNTVTYTPDADYSGPDSFTYTMCDGGGLCDTATVTVSVAALNDTPVVSDMAPVTLEDVPVTIDVIGAAIDPDGDALTVTSLTAPASGTVTIAGDGTVVYTPDADFFGTDTFQVTVCDPDGRCDMATVTVSVSSVNDPPVAVNDTATVLEDNAVAIPVLANDSDIEGDSLTVVAVSDAPGGTTGIVDNTVTFTPDDDWFGTTTITYTVSDGNGATATATVTVIVEPVNDPFVYSGPLTVVIGVGGVPDPLPSSDAEGDTLTYSVVDGALPPDLTLNPDGTWSGAADIGVHSVTIEACDDGSPTACSVFTLELQVTMLPVTGGWPGTALRLAVLSLLAGGLLVHVSKRRSVGEGAGCELDGGGQEPL